MSQRGFRRWLNWPIMEQLAFVRHQQERMETTMVDATALIAEMKTEVGEIRNVATAMATTWTRTVEFMEQAIIDAKAQGGVTQEAFDSLQDSLNQLKEERGEIITETLKNTRAAPDVPAMEEPKPAPSAEPV